MCWIKGVLEYYLLVFIFGVDFEVFGFKVKKGYYVIVF